MTEAILVALPESKREFLLGYAEGEKRVLRAYGRRTSTQITGRRFGINIGGAYL